MGFLTDGTALTWEEAQQYLELIKSEGIKQLIHIYNNYQTRKGDSFLWGDEIEYLLVTVDPEKKTAKLCLRGATVLDILAEDEKNNK